MFGKNNTLTKTTNERITSFDSRYSSRALNTAQKFLDSLEERGYQEGSAGLESNESGIAQAVRIVLDKVRSTLKARFKTLTNSSERLKNKLQDLKGKESALEVETLERQDKVKLAAGVLYTLSGIVYILGDIEFSRQTIVVAWQLSQDSLLGQVSLIIGIAMAAVLLKLVYERFIEVRFVEGSKVQDGIVKAFFFLLAPLFIFAFIQIAYVRGVIFKYSLINIATDIYDAIFSAHPWMNMVAFVGIAFMFLIGGAVLLTVGMKELREYTRFHKMRSRLKRIQKEISVCDHRLDKALKGLSTTENELDSIGGNDGFETEVDNKTGFYTSLYIREHHRGLKKYNANQEKADSMDIGDNFHEFVRHKIDLKSRRNGQIRSYNNDQS